MDAHSQLRKRSSKLTRKFLADMGIIERVRRRYRVQGDGTYLAHWEHWTARGCPLPQNLVGLDRFRTYRRIKRILKCVDRDHPDCILLELKEHAGGRPVTRKLVRGTIGSPAPSAVRRIEALTGRGRKTCLKRDGDPEQLFALFGAALRPAIEAFLTQERVPPILPPLSSHVGRVLAIDRPEIRMLAACLVVAGCGDRVRQHGIGMRVSLCERYEEILKGIDCHSPAEVECALRDYVDGKRPSTDTDWARFEAATRYAGCLNSAHGFVSRVFGGRGRPVSALLPSRVPEQRSFNAEMSRRFEMVKQPGRTKRIEHVQSVVPRLAEILIAVENVVAQAEGMVVSCLEHLAGAEQLLDAGLRAGFTYDGPVVRHDGSLGAASQLVDFRFEREGTLIERAHAVNPVDRNLLGIMPPAPGRWRRYGERHDPERWRRIYIVYEGTRPSAPGRECVEPGLADLFRWSLLESHCNLPETISRERRRLLSQEGLPLIPSTVDRLLVNPVSRRGVARYARTHDPELGAVVVPLIEYYHALCYARILVRYGIRWGARFAETMQFRLGDCFLAHTIRGEEEIYASLKPKGWVEHGRFGIDDGTLDAVEQAKDLANVLWWPGLVTGEGTLSLPVFRFGAGHRRSDLPPARYTFVGPRGALRPQTLLYFAMVLLFRILRTSGAGSRHGDRVIFATMMGLDGTGYDTLGHLLHHSPGSSMPTHYDLSPHIISTDAARRFNARQSAELIGKVTRD